jgi:DnaJ-class molecular chaperone
MTETGGRYDRCPRCKGRGWIPKFGFEWPLFLLLKFVKRETCPACGGSGRAPWKVQFPP